MAAATIRSIFAQTTADAVRTQLNVVADMLGGQLVPAQRDQFVVVRPSSPPQIPAHTCEKCSRAAAPLLCHASPHADADTYAKASIATTAP